MLDANSNQCCLSVISAICFLAYFGVAAVVTMMVPYNHLDGDAALSKAFDNRNNVAKYIVSAGALLGLTGTMIVSLVPMPRLLYSMAKDGLVFRFLGQVNSRTDVPVIATVVTGILTGRLEGSDLDLLLPFE